MTDLAGQTRHLRDLPGHVHAHSSGTDGTPPLRGVPAVPVGDPIELELKKQRKSKKMNHKEQTHRAGVDAISKSLTEAHNDGVDIEVLALGFLSASLLAISVCHDRAGIEAIIKMQLDLIEVTKKATYQ